MRRPTARSERALTGGGRWAAIAGGALTLAMAAALVRQLLGSGLQGLHAAMPASPWYFVTFALLYATPPLADYVIFRRLWALPAAGLAALTVKRIANEVLFGYAGEAYFFAWAKAHARGAVPFGATPFGAVKDVAILSAMAGNAVTLVAALAALPFAGQLLAGGEGRALLGSAAVVIATSLPFVLLRRRVFSLERGQLWWVFGVHITRLLATSLLLALAWAAALPGVGVGTWLLLSAVRLLFSRLPLVPNKDLLFANFALLTIGPEQPLAAVVAFTAALTLVVHVVLMAGFGVAALVRRASR